MIKLTYMGYAPRLVSILQLKSLLVWLPREVADIIPILKEDENYEMEISGAKVKYSRIPTKEQKL